MGIAMIWVLLHHADSSVHNILNIDYSYIFKFPLLILGYGGVDIFLFLSGFGIYLSLKKNPDIGQFLMRRIKRLLPSLPIIILFIVTTNVKSFHEIIGYITLENYWLDKIFLGYLSYIFLFYLLSPIFINILDNHLNTIKKQLFFLFTLFVLTIPYWHDVKLGGISRIIIYTIGLYTGYYFYNKKILTKKMLIRFIGLSVIAFLLLVYVFAFHNTTRCIHGLLWYPFCLFVPGFMFLCILIFEKLNIPLCVVNFFGKNSLEIYCVNYYVTTIIKPHGLITNLLYSILGSIIYIFIYKKLSFKISYLKNIKV